MTFLDEPELYQPDRPFEVTEADFALLPPKLQAEYLALLEREARAWTLTPKQQRAEDLTRECFFVGYGGAAGGGKSDWGLYHVFHYCKRYPRARVLILRTVLPELKRSLIPRSQEKFDHSVATYRSADKEWRFNNGSIIEFGYMNTEDDVYQYKSAEYDIVFIDEATEVTEFQFRYLMSRIRITAWRKNMGAWPHMILCTNPGGPGHGWFKTEFVEATSHGENIAELTFRDPLTGDVLHDPATGQPIVRRTAFVPAFVWDNPHMPEEYRLNLLQQDETTLRQLYYGDWDVFSGQFFTAWRHAIHVVRPFLIPPEWPRIRSLDYGTRNPYCCLWAAMDWDANLYVYRETYEAGLNAAQQARQVLELSMMAQAGRMVPERFRWTNADPAVFIRQGSGKNIAQQWAEGGLAVRPAKNDRIGGWSLVRQMLEPLPGLEYDHDLDTDLVRARLRVFSTCENLIRTLPNQIHDPVRVEDMLKNDDDHACDTLRYLVQGYVAAPPRAPSRGSETTEQRLIREHLARYDRATRQAHPILGAV